MEKLRRFFSLPLSNKRLLGEALFWVCLYRVKLWVLPYKWLGDDVSLGDPLNETEASPDWQSIRNVADSVRLTSRLIPQATCLTQALAARTLLKKRGQASKLTIGVDKDLERLKAHAWVEIDGRIVIGKLPRHNRFTVMDTKSLAI